MTFVYPHFDVRIERELQLDRLSWPDPGEAMDETDLGCNRCYEDLRRLSWSEAQRVYGFEKECIRRITNASQPDAEYDAIEKELENCNSVGLYELDIGVASTVVALSVARSIPFTSCNAGAFGGVHAELHPLVAFYARAETVTLLLECAESSRTGLGIAEPGCVIVYADDIRRMRMFADAVIERRSAFRRLQLSRGRVDTSMEQRDVEIQMELRFE